MRRLPSVFGFALLMSVFASTHVLGGDTPLPDPFADRPAVQPKEKYFLDPATGTVEKRLENLESGVETIRKNLARVEGKVDSLIEVTSNGRVAGAPLKSSLPNPAPATSAVPARNPDCGCLPTNNCGCLGTGQCDYCTRKAQPGPQPGEWYGPPTSAVPAPVVRPAVALTQKAAVGHTHTCSHGHTWDHTMDGGTHRCPFCGEFQNTVGHRATVTSYAGGSAYIPSSATAGVTYTITNGSGYGGGCSGAGCSSAGYSSGRTGWHLGKLFGR